MMRLADQIPFFFQLLSSDIATEIAIEIITEIATENDNFIHIFPLKIWCTHILPRFRVSTSAACPCSLATILKTKF